MREAVWHRDDTPQHASAICSKLPPGVLVLNGYINYSPAELSTNDHSADAAGPMLWSVPSTTRPARVQAIRVPRVQVSPVQVSPVQASRPAGRPGAGVFTVLAWLGGISLGYYLFCALGYGLYRLLQGAF